MKIKRRICGTLAFLSFMWMLGVIGNSDLGGDLNVCALIISAAIFGISIWLGGLME